MRRAWEARLRVLVDRIAESGARHPRRTLAAASVLIALLAVAAVGQRPGASTELLVDPDKGVGAATIQQERAFGSDPIFVVLTGEVTDVLAPASLRALASLEQQIGRLPGVRVVIGPGRFVGEAVDRTVSTIQDRLAPVAGTADRAARDAARRARQQRRPDAEVRAEAEAARIHALGPELRADFAMIMTRYGLSGLPSIDNAAFTSALVFGGEQTPKRRFRWLFPDRRHALVAIRLEPGLDDRGVAEAGKAIERIVDSTRLPRIQARVAGAPLVGAAVGGEMRDELLRLLPIALIVLAVLLMLTLRGGGRVLLLLPAAAAVSMTTVLTHALGLGISPATVAALPVVLGLTIDYVIQLRARYALLLGTHREEETQRAVREVLARKAVADVGPVLALAAVAMSGGFLVLTVSSVPLVDQLGQTLALGTLSAVVSVLVLGAPLLMQQPGRGGVREPRLRLPRAARRAIVHPVALTAVAGTALGGLALASTVPVEADIRRLVSPALPALRAVTDAQKELGTSGDLRIAITAPDVTDPQVLEWMRESVTQMLERDPQLRAGPNLPDLLASGASGRIPDRSGVRRLLELVPSAYVEAVMSPDRRRAELSLGIPLLALDEQRRLIARTERALSNAPPGVQAQPAGLIALASASTVELERGRPWLLLGAGFVAWLLLIVGSRPWRRAAIAVTPGLVAAGLCVVIVRAAGITLTPLSAVLEPLVLAVGVEFGLLLEHRYHELRRRGEHPAAAASGAVATVGWAVGASALTVAAGFATLTLSGMALLAQFGLIAALELVVTAIVAVALVPVLCVLLERRSAPAPRAELVTADVAQACAASPGA